MEIFISQLRDPVAARPNLFSKFLASDIGGETMGTSFGINLCVHGTQCLEQGILCALERHTQEEGGQALGPSCCPRGQEC